MGTYLIIGAILGSLFGWVLGSVTIGLLLGAVAGGLIGLILTKLRVRKPEDTGNDVAHVQLKEEQLDIHKERVQTGEVKIHKEVVADKKTITVPIKRQELVVELGDEEKYRIPLKEEEIVIKKNPVQVAEVSISKRQINEMEQVTEKVKKETLHVNSSEGDK
ncbi:YsnF/AvaK domain-containing protein [Halalkalibacter krulwichiae]|uniref:Stress response protein YsnF n=1 Tax=Halalkalibacter krulwichiae TaxID=199441 RepID=A0A1X9MES8_9BACI|nr:YsnF/AvaK domain-containing protein [Halalkalibacter krulwichiae]ARK31947.1 Stress response protein YsnF [Halalkalibacter krulwichiae]